MKKSQFCDCKVHYVYRVLTRITLMQEITMYTRQEIRVYKAIIGPSITHALESKGRNIKNRQCWKQMRLNYQEK